MSRSLQEPLYIDVISCGNCMLYTRSVVRKSMYCQKIEDYRFLHTLVSKHQTNPDLGYCVSNDSVEKAGGVHVYATRRQNHSSIKV